jgi:hypothetical protein
MIDSMFIEIFIVEKKLGFQSLLLKRIRAYSSLVLGLLCVSCISPKAEYYSINATENKAIRIIEQNDNNEDPLQYDPEWQRDLKLLTAVPSCNKGHNASWIRPQKSEIDWFWDTTWRWAKRGNLQARELIMHRMIYDGLRRPGGSKTSEYDRKRDIVVMAIHSLGSESDGEKALNYIALPVFLKKSNQYKEFWQCLEMRPSQKCAKIAVKSKIVPSFEKYVEEVEKSITDGEQASCF